MLGVATYSVKCQHPVDKAGWSFLVFLVGLLIDSAMAWSEKRTLALRSYRRLSFIRKESRLEKSLFTE